jgi:hypothetical protein
VTSSDLLSAPVGSSADLKVLHANHPVSHPRLLIVGVTNIGNTEISFLNVDDCLPNFVRFVYDGDASGTGTNGQAKGVLQWCDLV